MKKLLLVFSLLIILSPLKVSALGSQRCWTQKECEEYRKKYVDATQTKEGFYAADEHADALQECGAKENAIGDRLGFCLPAGKAVTKISFGGKNSFSNIGDFIQFIYKYGFVIASVVAVLMVITGGAMWIFSGGNSDTITGAKKKIGGAMMGLILLALSYSILNLVNPYLVNMRLPDIWAINEAGLAPPTCDKVESKATSTLALAYTQDQEKTITDKQKEELLQVAQYNTEKNKAACGSHYFVAGTQGQTCQGIFCKDGGGNVCFQKTGETKGCWKGSIAGNIINSSLLEKLPGSTVLAEEWAWEWVDHIGGAASDEMETYYVCLDNKTYGTTNIIQYDAFVNSEQEKTQYYVLPGDVQKTINAATQGCVSNGGLAGFLLGVEFNEGMDATSEEHWLGNNNNNAVDLGDEDNFKKILGQGKIPKSYFITPDQLILGIVINIDAGKVIDID